MRFAFLAVILLAGCGQGVHVNDPARGTKVDVDGTGIHVMTPDTNVSVDGSGIDVKTPDTKVEVR